VTLVAATTLTDLAATRLATLANVVVYRGEIINADGSTNVPTISGDPLGRVVPHIVMYPSPGRPRVDDQLAGFPSNLDWTLQLTMVAGYLTDCLNLIARVNVIMAGWIPVLSGGTTGRFMTDDPGPVRRDDTVNPSRFYVPQLFTLSAAG
jgi:hypothetical protein